MRVFGQVFKRVLAAADWRRRGTSAALSVALVALIVWALMRLGVLPTMLREPTDALETFDVSRDPGPSAPTPTRAAERERAAAPERAVERQAARPEPTPERPAILTPPVVPVGPPDMILLDREAFAGSDIGKMRGRGSPGAGAAAGDSIAAYGPGEGPGGQRLYNAEWVREPTNAELAGYLPPGGAPAGAYALIACRTVPGNQVENCRSLGESPLGSGLARAMRQAAWQFRVRPPRVGGKTLVGEWVRIRITFGTTG